MFSSNIIYIEISQSATENEYLDVIAHSTSAGEVILYPSHFAVIDCDDKKLRKERRVSTLTAMSIL